MSLEKMEEDFTEKVEKQIAEARTIFQSGRLFDAVEHLLSLEKQTRLGNDTKSTGTLAVEVVKMCAEAGDWKALNNYVVIISKRRAQLKMAVKKMVEEAMNWLDKTPNKETKLELIATLRNVTEGKIYVEVERARLTRILAKIREDEGKIAEAADIIQEVQIETVGSMERREKIDFILEQMRLCLDKKDYVRTSLISQKITRKSLTDKEVQDLKIRFYDLMIRYYTHFAHYIDIFTSYQAIYDTPVIQEDKAKWEEALQYMIIFLILSPFNERQNDFMQIVINDRKLEDIPVLKELLQRFIDYEIIFWPEFERQYSFLKNHPIFTAPEVGAKRWQDLHNRVIEHNIRVIAKYYSKIQLKRLAELLHLDQLQAEKFVSDSVTDKMIYAKIDRIDGVVNFSKPKDHTDVLNDWSSDITQLLGLVEKSCHLINKENMLHSAAAKKAKRT
eukprot:GEZU01044044.1.p1 GENE.GEZU01044044.1~~GEZU01044044.1.p1  ORF type:complete len:446 (-),score=167.70 GEZU01044044.1:104-1441(-)